MFFRTPSIHIDKVETVEIHAHPHPFWEEIIHEYLRSGQQAFPHPLEVLTHPMRMPPAHEKEDSRILQWLDYASKGVSILSGAAVITFVALLFFGQTTIGNIQVGSLLTILSFTLFGGLISVGGVKMFSITASLRKTREKIERAVTNIGGCPFMPLFNGNFDELRRPGSPRFCMRCPLGIDISPNAEGGLMHSCKVYATLHRQWRSLPNAEKYLHG